MIFAGTPAPTCGAPREPEPDGDRQRRTRITRVRTVRIQIADPDRRVHDGDHGDGLLAWALYGFPNEGGNQPWTEPSCRFGNSSRGRVSATANSTNSGNLDSSRSRTANRVSATFPDASRAVSTICRSGSPRLSDRRRHVCAAGRLHPLWRKLNESCCFCYSFAQLRDICNVLHLFDGSGALNPELIRQLAAFQMLRDPSASTSPTSQIRPRRPRSTPTARTPRALGWPDGDQVGLGRAHLCERATHHAMRHYRCEARAPNSSNG